MGSFDGYMCCKTCNVVSRVAIESREITEESTGIWNEFFETSYLFFKRMGLIMV